MEHRPTDEEIILKIKQQLCNQQMVFISSQFPMNADGYIVKEQIGEGMMSNKVYLAECPEREEQVAIKQIDLSQQSNDTKEKITKEVQGMSVVTCSEFVVRFHCSFVFEETLWIVMDLQEGSVRDVLKWKYPQGIDDESVICSILCQALQGIDFLHEQYMIHRDIKAGNILFNKDGQIKIADFGVSALLASHDERRTTMAGTWHWMAPEVIDPSDHGGHDFKADIWSLGITCIELAYGVAPYGDARPNQVIVYIMQNPPPTLDNPRVPSTNIKKYSNNFKELVAKCLQTDPKKRPTAAKLLTHKFFKEVPKSSTLKQALLDGLPSLGDRFRRQQELRKENLRANLAKSGTLPNFSLKLRSAKEKKSAKPKSPRGTPAKNGHSHGSSHSSGHGTKEIKVKRSGADSPRVQSPRTPPNGSRTLSKEDMVYLPREKHSECLKDSKKFSRDHSPKYREELSPRGEKKSYRDELSPRDCKRERVHGGGESPRRSDKKKDDISRISPKESRGDLTREKKLSRDNSQKERKTREDLTRSDNKFRSREQSHEQDEVSSSEKT